VIQKEEMNDVYNMKKEQLIKIQKLETDQEVINFVKEAKFEPKYKVESHTKDSLHEELFIEENII